MVHVQASACGPTLSPPHHASPISGARAPGSAEKLDRVPQPEELCELHPCSMRMRYTRSKVSGPARHSETLAAPRHGARARCPWAVSARVRAVPRAPWSAGGVFILRQVVSRLLYLRSVVCWLLWLREILGVIRLSNSLFSSPARAPRSRTRPPRSGCLLLAFARDS